MWYVLLHGEESSVLVVAAGGHGHEHKVHSIDAGNVGVSGDDVSKERMYQT